MIVLPDEERKFLQSEIFGFIWTIIDCHGKTKKFEHKTVFIRDLVLPLQWLEKLVSKNVAPLDVAKDIVDVGSRRFIFYDFKPSEMANVEEEAYLKLIDATRAHFNLQDETPAFLPNR